MAADVEIDELPLDSAGRQLKRAREAAGKTLAEISAATKIPERLLAAIEESRYSSLPSRIYAIGFSRSYARLVGLDEAAIVSEVRAEMDGVAAGSTVATTQAFAPGDPARIPELRLAIIAALGALVVIVAGLVFWHKSYNPTGSLPSILPAEAPPAVVTPTSATAAPALAPPAPVLTTGGAVSLSALLPGIWVKIYEASGKTLFVGPMAQGQTITLPPEAQAPLIWTARPDALAITIGGKPVAKLSETQKTMKGVPISATALLARTPPTSGTGGLPAATAAMTAQ